jgi:hypothetical protein
VEWFTTLLELAGLGLVVAGVSVVFWPAGLIVAGVAMLMAARNLTSAGGEGAS